MSGEWKMPQRGAECAGCRRAFAVGEDFRAFLYETETGYERRDYCAACPPTDGTPIGAWRTRRPEPAAKRVLQFDREAIYGFFERLADASEPAQLQLRFVLALLLWRKKVLKLERTLDQNGHEAWEFVAARAAARHRVERPDLAEEELDRLSVQLEGLLAGQAVELHVSGIDLRPEDSDA